MPTNQQIPIVEVNVNVNSPPAPSAYQQSGAIVSLGATTLTALTYQYFSTASEMIAVIGTAGNFAEVTAQANSYFAAGTNNGVYVLELGVQSTINDGITALQTWITDNPGILSAFLTSATWDGTALNTMALNFASNNSGVYFFVTTTVSTVADYTGTKSVFAFVPAAGMPSTAADAAVVFAQWLANSPSVTNKLQGMGYRFLPSATPWPAYGVTSSVQTILNANGNLALSGAATNTSNTALFKGLLANGNQASFWFGVDWINFNGNAALTNAIANGSNNQPPILYDQAGINTLEAVLEQLCDNAVTFGCAQSATVSAVPFSTYTAQNPSDYSAGLYKGFTVTIVGQNQFLNLVFNVQVNQPS